MQLIKSIWLVLILPFALQAEGSKTFSAVSADYRTALLELYTSQGCHSCPPTEHWLGKLAGSGYSPERVVPIALHVDYWDYIGWKDEFASPAHTQRQRLIGARNRSNTIYTPQLVLNGRDMRPRSLLRSRLTPINQQPAAVKIQLVSRYLDTQTLVIDAKLDGAIAPGSKLFLAVTENNLSSEIDAGENAGKRLGHEHVVRTMKVYALNRTDISDQFSLGTDWQRDQLAVVAFIESVDGDILQALQLRLGNI